MQKKTALACPLAKNSTSSLKNSTPVSVLFARFSNYRGGGFQIILLCFLSFHIVTNNYAMPSQGEILWLGEKNKNIFLEEIMQYSVFFVKCFMLNKSLKLNSTWQYFVYSYQQRRLRYHLLLSSLKVISEFGIFSEFIQPICSVKYFEVQLF